MSYDNWRKRLEIAKLPTVAQRRAALTQARLLNMEPTILDEGYYRKAISEKRDGKTVIIDYVPLAIFVDGSGLCGVLGNRDLSTAELADVWTWISPISYELYQAVAERGEKWPDLMTVGELYAEVSGHPQPPLDAIERIIGRDHNEPPEVLPEVAHAQAIDAAIGAAPTAVASEQGAALALGSKNRLAELRLAADKAGKALYQPPYAEYKRLHDLWTPMVKRAQNAEDKIVVEIRKFRESERRRIADEQAKAEQAQREIEEANARAADRAIAAGEPEAAPEVVEIEQPAPLAPVTPTYGTRKLREEVKWHLDEITDWDAVYQYFKGTEQVKQVLLTLATAGVRAGRTVPGTKTHEGLI